MIFHVRVMDHVGKGAECICGAKITSGTQVYLAILVDDDGFITLDHIECGRCYARHGWGEAIPDHLGGKHVV